MTKKSEFRSEEFAMKDLLRPDGRLRSLFERAASDHVPVFDERKAVACIVQQGRRLQTAHLRIHAIAIDWVIQGKRRQFLCKDHLKVPIQTRTYGKVRFGARLFKIFAGSAVIPL